MKSHVTTAKRVRGFLWRKRAFRLGCVAANVLTEAGNWRLYVTVQEKEMLLFQELMQGLIRCIRCGKMEAMFIVIFLRM